MTVTIELSPEKEALLKQQAEVRGLTIEQWLLQLAEHSRPVQIEKENHDARPIWEVILDNMKDIPTEDLAALPKDGASQIDHYIYGVPKRAE